MKDLYLAPMDGSSWLGVLWPGYNRGSLWLYNVPEALHGLKEGQKRACHQPELCWTWEGEELVARTEPENADPQAGIELRLTQDEYGFRMVLQVENVGDEPYLKGAVFDACLRNNGAWKFADPAGERTLVRKGGSWVSLFDLFGDEAITRARSMPLDAPDSADEGIIVRVGQDGEHVVATAWDRVSGLASNLGPQISCIHSDPALGPLAPDESTTCRGRLWFAKLSLNELYERYREEF
jgi:hypothetical protein